MSGIVSLHSVGKRETSAKKPYVENDVPIQRTLVKISPP